MTEGSVSTHSFNPLAAPLLDPLPLRPRPRPSSRPVRIISTEEDDEKQKNRTLSARPWSSEEVTWLPAERGRQEEAADDFQI